MVAATDQTIKRKDEMVTRRDKTIEELTAKVDELEEIIRKRDEDSINHEMEQNLLNTQSYVESYD